MKAFPSKNAPYYINEDGASAHQSGMDLRDYFAAKAMQAMLVNRNEAVYLQEMPKICYQWADAMIKARTE